jgi:hypothetical protein
MFKFAVPISAAAVMVLAGCGGGPNVRVGEADELLPAATASDWRTYADHLVLAEVTSAVKLPMTQEEIAAGEGFAPRRLTFTIDKVLWSQDGSRPAPSELQLEVDGWTVHDGKATPLRFSGEPVILEGHSYVLPITYLRPGRLVSKAQWSNLSVTAIVPADQGELGHGDDIVGSPSAVVTKLIGRPVAAAAKLLSETPLPEVAESYMDLPPTDRFKAIDRAQERADVD